jgi:hypothetical protein
VEDLCGVTGVTSGGTGDIGNAGEEGELLQRLLRRIDHVRSNRRIPRSEVPGHSRHAEERPSAVSQRVEVNGSSSTSTPTTETSEGEHEFERATYLLIPRASIKLASRVGLPHPFIFSKQYSKHPSCWDHFQV